MPNATTKIIVSNLHKMHLTLRDGKHQVKACTAPTLPIPLTIKEGSTTQTLVRVSGDMIVVQSHALFLKEMRRLHVHFIEKLIAQYEHIEIISTDLLAFKMDMERDFFSFHVHFQTMKANIQEITDTLKKLEQADELKMVTRQSAASPSSLHKDLLFISICYILWSPPCIYLFYDFPWIF